MQKTALFLALTLVLTGIALAQSTSSPRTLVVRCGMLIDGKSDIPSRNVEILIEGDRIKAVGASVTHPAGTEVIDLGNATVLPGMIDGHTHVLLQGDITAEEYDSQLLKESIPYRTLRASASVRTALENGFTALRDVETEGAMYADVDIKRSINAGIIPGPRMQVSTRALDVTGAYPLAGYSWELHMPKGVQVVDGPDECRKAVREQIERGADWIKVYADRSYYIGSDGKIHSIPTFTMPELTAIVEEAHRLRHKVATHAIGLDGIQNALDAGVDSVEHGDGFDDATIAQAVRQGTFWCPTIFVGEYVAEGRAAAGAPIWVKMLPLHHEAFRKAVAAGVKIAFGTDAGGFAWTENEAKEFPLMVKYGMTPMQAIKSATSVAAQMLGWQDQIGSIEPGKFADIVAVPTDPLREISELERVGFVMKGGRVIKNTLAPQSSE